MTWLYTSDGKRFMLVYRIFIEGTIGVKRKTINRQASCCTVIANLLLRNMLSFNGDELYPVSNLIQRNQQIFSVVLRIVMEILGHVHAFIALGSIHCIFLQGKRCCYIYIYSTNASGKWGVASVSGTGDGPTDFDIFHELRMRDPMKTGKHIPTIVL